MMFSENWLSLYARQVLVAVTLLTSAIGYFILHQYILPECTVQIGETTEQAVLNMTQILNTSLSRQQLVPPLLENQWTNNNGESYCQFEAKCKTIRCSHISGQLDPGNVTKAFIENIFKVECRLNVITSLIFEKSTFPGNELQEMWLETDITIEKLTLADCSLTALSDKAFASTTYSLMKKLYLLNNNIYTLKRATFRHLLSLQHLQIEGNEIKQAEENLLTDIAGTLQCLKLDGAIKNVAVLRNITGRNVLPQLQVLSLQYNYIPIIDSQLFAGIPNLVSLYLSASHIKTVYADTFSPISTTMKQLLMSDNNISTLPEGQFDSIIQQNPNFALTIDNNPWHCDCSLKWMQNMIRDHRYVVKNILICNSPENNAGRSFNEANFCDDTTLNITKTDMKTCSKVTSTTTSVSKISTTEPREIIHVDCHVLSNRSLHSIYSRRVFSTTDLEISLQFRHFSAMQFENGTVLITLSDSNDVFLIWFPDKARSNTANLKQSIHCVGKVRSFFLLQHLQPQTSYTICSLDDFSTLFCLSLTTSSFELESWLNRIGKDVIVAVFVVSLILMCLLSAMLMFVMIRRHPTMLRGNKRIVIVKRRTLDAMVLPKGLSSDIIHSAIKNTVPTISQYLKEEDEYVTPLPPMRPIRKNSRSSTSSATQSDSCSYISGIEPTLSQLNSWRLKRTLNMKWEPEPPPLPTHPQHHVAQPLSIMANLNENRFENLTYM